MSVARRGAVEFPTGRVELLVVAGALPTALQPAASGVRVPLRPLPMSRCLAWLPPGAQVPSSEREDRLCLDEAGRVCIRTPGGSAVGRPDAVGRKRYKVLGACHAVGVHSPHQQLAAQTD